MLTNALPRDEHFSAFASKEATNSAILAALPRTRSHLDSSFRHRLSEMVVASAENTGVGRPTTSMRQRRTLVASLKGELQCPI